MAGRAKGSPGPPCHGVAGTTGGVSAKAGQPLLRLHIPGPEADEGWVAWKSPTAGGAMTPDPLRPYVPRLSAEWLTQAPQETARRIEGSLVSADISGFTRLTEQLSTMGRRGAEELTDLLNTCFDEMIDLCLAEGGDVIKFGGDALLVLFRGEDDAVHACRASHGMRAIVAKPVRRRDDGAVRLGISIGVHSGSFAFYLPLGAHRELLITGPDVSTTLDREAAANAGEIHVSEAAAERLPSGAVGQAVEGGHLLRRVPALPGEAIRPPWPDADLATLIPAEQRAAIEGGAVGEHRQAAVAFICFKHTDHLLADGDIGALDGPLQRLADCTATSVARHAVHWLASDAYADGGKLILAGGVPATGVHDEEHLLRAVRDIVDDVGGELELHCGINRGVVFAGNLGASNRRTYTAMGDAVNLAARLMQKSGAGEVVASQAIVARCRSRLDLTRMEPFFVKGKEAPIDAAVVHAIDHETFDAVQRPFPLVGRDVELARLLSATRSAMSGRGEAVEIVGSVGAGKTRLAAELQLMATGMGLSVTRWSCEPFYKMSPYRAVESLFRRAVGISHDASRADAGARLGELVDERAPELAPWLPLIAVPFAADVGPTQQSEELLPEYRRVRIQEVVSALFSALIIEPSLIIFEDTQWADADSLALMEALARVVRERPWLLCTTSHGPDVSVSGVEALRLQPLSESDAQTLARSTPAGKAMESENMAALLDRASGNALFVVELMAASESGAMEAIPDTVEALIAARLDQFNARDRVLVQEASVFGMDLDLGILAAVLGPEAADEVRWNRLSTLVRPVAPGVWRFGHDLFRQTIYEAVSYRRRREIHGRIGGLIETFAEGDERAGLLATHFDLAEAHDKAWTYAVVAGDRANRLYANAEATHFYQLALGHALRLNELAAAERAAVAESLGDVHERLGALDEAAAAYAVARGFSQAEAVIARLWRKSGVLRVHQSRYASALRLYTKARDRLLTAGVEVEGELAELAAAYAGVRFRQGRYSDCLEWAERARREAEASANRSCLAHSLALIDLSAASLGVNHGAYALRALSIYEEVGHLVGQANVLNNLGAAAWEGGRWREALEYYERSKAIRERSGDAIGTSYSNFNIAEVLVEQGHADAALDILGSGLAAWETAKFSWGLAYGRLLKARAAVRKGSLLDAEPLVDEARDQFTEIGTMSAVSECDLLGLELRMIAEPGADVRNLIDALRHDFVGREGDERFELPLLRMSCVAFARCGEYDMARAEVDRAIGLAGELGARGDLAEAYALRRDLAEAYGRVVEPQDAQQADNLSASLGVVTPRRWDVARA